MDFPRTNKIHQERPVNEAFGDNAKLLETAMKQVDWRYMRKAYIIGFGTLLVSLFLLIVVVRAAFVIF